MKPVERFDNIRVMSREQVRAFDRWAINELGIPGLVLMENAGRACVEVIQSFVHEKLGARIGVICGTGNNGGDGFVIARHLLNLGLQVDVLICGDPARIRGDAAVNLSILQAMDITVEAHHPQESSIQTILRSMATESDIVVDALFGTGLSGELRSGYEQIVAGINTLQRPVLSVDIPSGLDCDTGRVLGQAVKATWTVTFVAVKTGFCQIQARQFTGLIYVASIGIDPLYWSPEEASSGL